jgi:hypothetical protein
MLLPAIENDALYLKVCIINQKPYMQRSVESANWLTSRHGGCYTEPHIARESQGVLKDSPRTPQGVHGD